MYVVQYPYYGGRNKRENKVKRIPYEVRYLSMSMSMSMSMSISMRVEMGWRWVWEWEWEPNSHSVSRGVHYCRDRVETNE